MTKKTEPMPNSSQPDAETLKTSDLSFQWNRQQKPISYPDIRLSRGHHLFLEGASGTGKSTLMSLMCGLITPTAGTLSILGTELSGLNGGQRDRFRANHIGVIFQQFNLVPYLNPLDNVKLPCRLSKERRDRTQDGPTAEATFLLDALGIPAKQWQSPIGELSVGQQQRVAAARALIGGPKIILADEPTSALDANNRDRFVGLLLDLAAKQQSSVVFVSHDHSLADRFDAHLTLEAIA